MAKYLLTYDLIAPGRNYQTLWSELGRFSATRVLLSTWVFRRLNTTCVGLREHFKRFVDGNDRLLIIDISDENWASWNVRDMTRL